MPAGNRRKDRIQIAYGAERRREYLDRNLQFGSGQAETQQGHILGRHITCRLLELTGVGVCLAMAAKPKPSIRMAMRSCLSRCALSETPLVALAEFAEKLTALGWDRESVREVERGVLAILFGHQAESRRTIESN